MRVLGAIGRGLAWSALVVFVLVAAIAVYFIVFPPFRIPETGTLHGELRRDVTLRPGSPVVALLLEVRQGPELFRGASSSTFPPTHLQVSTEVADGGGTTIELRLYPGSAEPATDLAPGTDGGSTAWSIDCRVCSRTYLLVLSAKGITSDIRATVDIDATLRFPPHVEAPFLAAIGLDLDDLAVGDGVSLDASEVAGSARIAPETPAVWQPVSLPEAHGVTIDGRSIAGLRLEIEATRIGDMIPVGLRAPPPVRLALVDTAGKIAAEVEVPAGTTRGVALPPLSGEYRLVVLWQDRAAQAYDVSWRLEAGSVTNAPSGTVTGAAQVEAPRVDGIEAQGSIELTVNGNRPKLNFGVGIDLGLESSAYLRPVAGVARFTLELDEPPGHTPVTLGLKRDGAYESEMLVELVPGQPVEVTLDAVGRCVYRCTPWVAEIPRQPEGGLVPGAMVSIKWHATFELWDLVPQPHASWKYFYELEQVGG